MSRGVRPLLILLCTLPLLVGLLVACGSQTDSRPQNKNLNDRAAYYFSNAQRAYQAGALRPALALTDSVLAHQSDVAAVWFLRGQIYSGLEQYAQAQKAFEEAHSIAPGPNSLFNLATTAFHREEYRASIKYFKQVLEQIEDHPDQVFIYDDDPGGDQARYNTMLQMGRAYGSLGKADSARLWLNRAVDSNENRAVGYDALSQQWEEEGDLQRALAFAREALERDSSSLEYRYRVGNLLFRTGKVAEAVPYLRTVAREDPDHRGAHYNLGRALAQQGKEREGKRYLAEADSIQQVEEKLSELRETVEVNPNKLQPLLKYAKALREAHRYDRAMEAYQSALGMVPQAYRIPLMTNIANLAMVKGDTTEALQRYRSILRVDSTQSDVWLNLGVAYYNSGRTSDARRAWRSALRHNPKNREARGYLDRLE